MRSKGTMISGFLAVAVMVLSFAFEKGYLNYYSINRILKSSSYFTYGLISKSLPDKNVFVLNIPFHRQEHSLSCEVASLKMVLDYYGMDIPESELIAKLSFETFGSRDTENNIWGNPNNGFVGNIDGKIPNEGYGVYEDPIVKIANNFRGSKKLENPELPDVLEIIKAGHPVIVWGAISSGKDISWKTRGGDKVKAVFGEHTRVLIGYKGNMDNPTTIYLMDPIYGKIQMSKDKFIKNWGTLDKKAVVIY